MGIIHNNVIVTENLKLLIDPANPKSYPGKMGPELVTNNVVNGQPFTISNDGTTSVKLDLGTVESGKFYKIAFGPVVFNSFAAPGEITIAGNSANVSPGFLVNIENTFYQSFVIEALAQGTLSFEGLVGANLTVNFASLREILSSVNVVTDLSGNGNDGLLLNTVRWLSPEFEGMPRPPAFFLNFDDTYNSYIDFGDVGFINDTLGELSFSFWLKNFGGVSSAQTIILSKWDDIGEGFFVNQTTTGNINVSFINGDNGDQLTSSTAIPYGSNLWYNIAVTWKVNEPLKIYINGELDSTSTVVPSFSGFANNTQPLRISGFPDGSLNFIGNISVLQMYDRQLNDDEVRKNFNAFRSRFRL